MVRKIIYAGFSLSLLLMISVFYTLHHLEAITHNFLQQAHITVEKISWRLLPSIGLEAHAIKLNSIEIADAKININLFSIFKIHRDLLLELQKLKCNDVVLPTIYLQLKHLSLTQPMPLLINFDVKQPIPMNNHFLGLMTLDLKKRMVYFENITANQRYKDAQLVSYSEGTLKFNWQENQISTQNFYIHVANVNTDIKNFLLDLNTLHYQGELKLHARDLVLLPQLNISHANVNMQFNERLTEARVLVDALKFANLEFKNINVGLNYDGYHIKATDIFANLQAGNISANGMSDFYHHTMHAHLENVEIRNLLTAFGMPFSLSGIAEGQLTLDSFGKTRSEFVDHLSLQANINSRLGYLPAFNLPMQINQQLRQQQRPAILSERNFYNTLEAKVLVQQSKIHIDMNADTPELLIHASTQQNIENPSYTFNVSAQIKNKILDQMGVNHLALKNNFAATMTI